MRRTRNGRTGKWRQSFSLGLSELQSTARIKRNARLRKQRWSLWGGGFVASTSGLRARSGMIGVQALATSGRRLHGLLGLSALLRLGGTCSNLQKKEKEVNDGCPYPRPLQKKKTFEEREPWWRAIAGVGSRYAEEGGRDQQVPTSPPVHTFFSLPPPLAWHSNMGLPHTHTQTHTHTWKKRRS